MDIVNWDYLKKGLLIKDALQSSDDLVLVAANTSYSKRGDLYQTYAVPASAIGGGGGGLGPVGVMFKQTTPGTTVEGNSQRAATYVLEIPAGTFAPGDIIRVHYRAYKARTASDTTMSIAIGPVNNIFAVTTVANARIDFNPAAPFPNRWGQMKRDFVVPSDSTPMIVLPTKIETFTDDIESEDIQAITIDWSVTQYMLFTIEHQVGTDDRASGLSYYVEKL
jgi:hypothetical protein